MQPYRDSDVPQAGTVDTLERQVWLFTRGAESIRITRDAAGTGAFIDGPGPVTERQSADTVAAFDHSLNSYLERLHADGWVLRASVDRRQRQDPIPPHAHDRRRQR